MLKRLFAVLFGSAVATSPVAAGQWLEGGLYVTPQENGRFVPLKILKVDDHGVHIRIYSNVYPAPPSHIDESTLYMAGVDKREEEPLGMGHLPVSNQSFSGWEATFVQQSSVNTEELEGYQMWLEAEGGYF
ncbi:hypothetical protein [Dokdonella sp.]|uniref:hypothetical protein n=1 Tax=Dokdonella sp. TaxID=2291710 RepID=UPI0025C580B9|nr:hypothetical protein [Dokdonella sp.]MBX3690622.1 hypothetical protein [Dokdonella sp.]